MNIKEFSIDTIFKKKFKIKGGLVKTGFPVSPVVGPLGLNAKKIIDEINLKTKEYYNLNMVVELIYDKIKKESQIIVKEPSISTKIKKFLKITRSVEKKVLSEKEFDNFLKENFKLDLSKKEINCIKGSLRSCKIFVE